MTTVNSSIRKAIATAIPGLFIVESGIVKIVGLAAVVQDLSKAGLSDFAVMLGVIEVVLAIFFMIGKTMRIALIGLSCYLSGAIATELTHGSNGIFPLVLLTLVWISTLIRDRYIFRMPIKKTTAITDLSQWTFN
jgi:uncharacterized membrane protein YphA (DoxX/SURF4 family)